MDAFELKIAEIAHDCWRQIQGPDHAHSALREDEHHSIQDAMVPFDQLSQIDRDTAVQCIRHHNADDSLATMIEYPRGPERPITAPEAQAGIAVTLADQPNLHGSVAGFEPGEFDWQTSAVTVSWSDGQTTTHITEERELRRV